MAEKMYKVRFYDNSVGYDRVVLMSEQEFIRWKSTHSYYEAIPVTL